MTQQIPGDIVEVEWQFSAVDVRPVARWLDSAALGGFSARRGPTKVHHDRYYDTPDWRVHAARYTCRVRDKADGAELTLKAFADSNNSLKMRRELTDVLPEPTVEAIGQSTGAAGAALASLTGRAPVVEIFQLETTRHIYELSDTEGHLGEIALDETTIPVGVDEPPVRLARVEVEVAADAVDRARSFVEHLAVGCGLVEAGTSKFEAAMLATGISPATRAKAFGQTDITSSMTTGEVAFAIMRKHFGVFLANEPGTRLGEDIEALHDMRVAARRLRAAMQAFRMYLPARIESIRAELGWVAGVLGDVRDLDVQLERMDEWRSDVPAESAHSLDAIEQMLSSSRSSGRRRMLAALDSRRYELFVGRFSALLQRGPAKSFAPGRMPILATAPDLLEARYRKLRKHGDKISADSPAEDYHLLRIDGKKLRYALEFVGPIYGAQATDFARQVTELQDVLGLHQDAEVAREMLAGMASSNRRLSPETVLVMGMIAERYRAHASELRGKFPTVYRRLRGRRWQKLRSELESRRPPPRVRRAPATVSVAPRIADSAESV